MKKSHVSDLIEPMDLADMRHNGVRSLEIVCQQCRHQTVMNVDHLPGDLTVKSLEPGMVCTKCGTIGADVRPNWKERGRWPMAVTLRVRLRFICFSSGTKTKSRRSRCATQKKNFHLNASRAAKR
jgi:hypothetical protein